MLQFRTVIVIGLITQVVFVSEIFVSGGPVGNPVHFSDDKIEYLKQFSEQLKSTLSPEIDPCEDFHGYVCKKTNISRDHIYGDLDFDKNDEILTNYLGNSNLSDAELKLKNYYTSCQQRRKNDNVKNSVREFRFTGLAEPWPAFDSNWKGEKFDFLSVIAELRIFGASVIIDQDIRFEPHTGNRYLVVELEEFNFIKFEKRQEYLKEQLSECGVANVEDIIKDAVQVEQECVEALSAMQAQSVESTELKTDFCGLKKEIPEVDWDTQIELTYGQTLEDTCPVEIKNAAALRKVLTTVSKLNPKMVANYLFCNFIYYLPTIQDKDYVSGVDQECYSYSLHKFRDVFSGIFVKKFFDNEAKELMIGMMNSFLEIMKKSALIYSKTIPSNILPASPEKLLSEEYFSAFSDENLKKEYESVEIDANNFLQNTFQLRRRAKSKSFGSHINGNDKVGILKDFHKSKLSSYFSIHFNKISNELSPLIFDEVVTQMKMISNEPHKTFGSDANSTSLVECFDRQLSTLKPQDQMLLGNIFFKMLVRAYEDWADKNQPIMKAENEVLKDFGLTSKKVLFLVFMQYACGEKSQDDRVWVSSVFWNTKEFSDAFQCPVGSRMNPVEKCQITNI